jgi:hypothetical protein
VRKHLKETMTGVSAIPAVEAPMGVISRVPRRKRKKTALDVKQEARALVAALLDNEVEMLQPDLTYRQFVDWLETQGRSTSGATVSRTGAHFVGHIRDSQKVLWEITYTRKTGRIYRSTLGQAMAQGQAAIKKRDETT